MMSNRICWKRQPIIRGITGLFQTPRGFEGRVKDEDGKFHMAAVVRSVVSIDRKSVTWYYAVYDRAGVEPCVVRGFASEDEALAACKAYLKA
jgi:hypothetical protein